MFRYFNRWTPRKKQDRKRMKRRRLRAETLEPRQLLTVDYLHNELLPEDVNNDGSVSAVDALAIMNAMDRQASSDGDLFTDVNNDGRRTARDAVRLINRLGRESSQSDQRGGRGDRTGQDDQAPSPNPSPGPDLDSRPDPVPPRDSSPNDNGGGGNDGGSDLIDASFLDETRTFDGSGNHLDNPLLGSTEQPLLRIGQADYADGIAEPAGADRPSAREISNVLSDADPNGTSSQRNLSAFVYAWGQFLDHDIDLSGEPEDESQLESFDIEVPIGDPSFDPAATGEQTIPLTRSDYDPDTGTSIDNPRQQLNEITAWVDGSQVYGSDQETADSLREFVGGRMLITENGLLPTDEEGDILAGDVRAAENIGLTAMHALFVREHNRLADEISAANPGLSDEEIYQQARALVIAEMQSITYNEYLPALLGDEALTEYQGYDSTVDPSIANEFSTAAFRFGHSTLLDEIEFIGNDGTPVGDEISLAEAFFNPYLLEETGIDSILKFDASTVAQEIDLEVVDSL